MRYLRAFWFGFTQTMGIAPARREVETTEAALDAVRRSLVDAIAKSRDPEPSFFSQMMDRRIQEFDRVLAASRHNRLDDLNRRRRQRR